MIALIAILLALIPAVAILYPFLRKGDSEAIVQDESSPAAELDRRWSAAVAGLKSAELERALGNLSQDDYLWLRQQYMTEAALVMKAMELEERQERNLHIAIEREIRSVRERAVGPDEGGSTVMCAVCSTQAPQGAQACPECGTAVSPDTGQGNRAKSVPQARVSGE